MSPSSPPTCKVPQIHQADLILERQVARNTVVSASYLLSLGRELPNFIDINLDPASRTEVTYTFDSDYYSGIKGPYNGHTLTVPVYTARLNPNFQTITQIRSNVNSSYNALVLQFNRTMSRGLAFRFNYTWSHALDFNQNSTTFTTYNNTLSPIPFTYQFDGVPHYVARPDYGTSNYDIRHRMTGSLYWSPRLFSQSRGLLHDALDHWTLAPIVQISTGKPFSDDVSGHAPSHTCARMPLASWAPAARPACPSSDATPSATATSTMPICASPAASTSANAKTSSSSPKPSISSTTRFHRPQQHLLHRLHPPNSTLEYDSNFNTPTAAANTLYREREIQLAARFHF